MYNNFPDNQLMPPPSKPLLENGMCGNCSEFLEAIHNVSILCSLWGSRKITVTIYTIYRG